MFDTKPVFWGVGAQAQAQSTDDFGGYVYGDSCGQQSSGSCASAWPPFDDFGLISMGDGDSCNQHFDLPALENADEIELPMISPNDPETSCADLQLQWGVPAEACGSGACGQNNLDPLDFSSIWDESVKMELPELSTNAHAMYAINNNSSGGGGGDGMDCGMDNIEPSPSLHTHHHHNQHLHRPNHHSHQQACADTHALVFPASAASAAQGSLGSAVAVRVTKIVSTRFPQCGRKDWFDLKLNLSRDPFTGVSSINLSQIRAVLCQRMHQPIEFDAHSLVVLKIKRRHLVGGDRGQRKTELSKQKVAFQREWGWHQLAPSTGEDDKVVVDPAEDLLYITAQCHCGKLVTSEMTKIHPNHRYCRQHVKCLKAN